MLIVGGRNEYNQLGENSNNTDFDGEPIISPAVTSHLDLSTLLSYSIYSSHLVWITKNKKAYAVGFNSGNKISSTIPTGKLDKCTEVKILDNEGRSCSFLSAVCGTYFTLYLISSQYNNKFNKLAFVYQGEDNGRPLFLNTGNLNPISLYGGRQNAAAINSDGSILILTANIYSSPLSLIKPIFLPNSEKAICIGCCDTFIIALSSSGHVYECKLTNGKISTFSEVIELRRFKFIDVSGAYTHCFAVTNDGRVFGRGSNLSGQLGIGPNIEKSDTFIEIKTFKGQKVIQASAGRFHSLFLTSEGKILGCGKNTAGSLLLTTGNSKNNFYLPTETSITADASYCFAGNSLSTVIKGKCIPPNLPNHRIVEIQSSKKVPSNDQEIENLKKKIDEIEKKKNDELQMKNQEIANLRKQNELQKKQIDELQIKQQEREKAGSSESKDQEIANLKKQIETQRKKIAELQLKISKKSFKKPSPVKQIPKELNIINVTELDKIKKIGKVGRGAMAKVFKVTREQVYAMKVIDSEFCSKEESGNETDLDIDFDKIKRFFQEYEIINQLNHANIVKTFGFCFGDKTHKPSILLEFCPYNLKKCVKSLNNEQRISIIIEISDAMKHVHEAGFIHRDLKLENILLDNEMHVKLSDFGISTLMVLDSETMNRTQMSGTLPFMAPELILGRTDYNEKVDIYAFGIVLYLILNNGEYPQISIGDVANGKIAKIPESVTSFSQGLIKKCWSFQASDRPSFDEIYQTLINNKSKIVSK